MGNKMFKDTSWQLDARLLIFPPCGDDGQPTLYCPGYQAHNCRSYLDYLPYCSTESTNSLALAYLYLYPLIGSVPG
jgi:hypothetical protein